MKDIGTKITVIPIAVVLSLLAMQARAQTDSTAALSGGHTVTSGQMNKGLVTGGLDALSGKAAGVTVSTGANRGAMLSAVRVRGTASLTGGNDPLVIIDGVTSDLSTLGFLYPGDIDSFNILKDASETARYGSRGSSGVIEVTTRKSRGGAFSISYDGTAGIETVTKNLDMLDAGGFRKYCNSLAYDFYDGGADTYMPGSIVRTGFVMNHHVAFGGGSQDSRYRASIGILDHSSVIKGNGYRSYSAKLDIDQKALDGLLDFALGMYGSRLSSSEIHDPQHLFYSAAAFNPTVPSGKGKNGAYTQIPAASQINNPYSLLEKDYDTDNALFNAHLQVRAQLTDRVSLTAFGAYSYNNIGNSHFFPTIIWSHGEAYRDNIGSTGLLGNLKLSWNGTLGNNPLDIDILTEGERIRTSRFNTTTVGFSTNVLGYNSIQAGSYRPWDGTASSAEHSGLLSFLGSASYGIGDKFSISGSVRADASSKFGRNHRWGLFPSLSGSYVISKEEFLSDIPWLNKLKINAGAGQSGNQGALGAYYSGAWILPYGLVGYEGDPTVSFASDRNSNPDLKWEVRTACNAGVEASLLDERLIFTAEYYNYRISDMLYNYEVSVPPFTYNSLMANLGKMSGWGLEYGLGFTPLQKKDMELNISMNLSMQRDRLISLSGWYKGEYLNAPDIAAVNALNGAGFHGGNNDVVYRIVGQPLGVFYLPHCKGIATAQDGTRYYDVEEDSYHIAGQAVPKATLGSNISFRYRDWDISVQVNGAFGHKIFNGTALTYMNMESLPYYNVLAEAPSMNIHDQTISDWWLERGDYLNVDYLTAGWSVPLRSARISNLRLSASVNNLLTITSYSGLTPMINSSVLSSTLGLDDKVTYPVYKSFSLSLSIQFK